MTAWHKIYSWQNMIHKKVKVEDANVVNQKLDLINSNLIELDLELFYFEKIEVVESWCTRSSIHSFSNPTYLCKVRANWFPSPVVFGWDVGNAVDRHWVHPSILMENQMKENVCGSKEITEDCEVNLNQEFGAHSSGVNCCWSRWFERKLLHSSCWATAETSVVGKKTEDCYLVIQSPFSDKNIFFCQMKLDKKSRKCRFGVPPTTFFYQLEETQHNH